MARRERYLAANEALRSMCQHEGRPLSEARIFTAHTADDRIENFYMRSIVGTGPGGFRSMLYRNGPVVRPLLDLTRDELRDYLSAREAAGETVVRDESGALWREDATNAHTDRFRAYVRHKIVPVAKEWNSALPEVLTRSMNLIADEDDMLQTAPRASAFCPHLEKRSARCSVARCCVFWKRCSARMRGWKPLAWKPCSLASRTARPTAGM